MKLVLLATSGEVLDSLEFTREEWDDGEISALDLHAGSEAT